MEDQDGIRAVRHDLEHFNSSLHLSDVLYRSHTITDTSTSHDWGSGYPVRNIQVRTAINGRRSSVLSYPAVEGTPQYYLDWEYVLMILALFWFSVGIITVLIVRKLVGWRRSRLVVR